MQSLAIRDIDITLLRTFVAVVETGGMTKAAALQNLTQAAVSQQIKRLEELFDQPLFDRSQKQIQPTATGEKLFSHAKRMINLNDEIWSTMTAPAYEGEIHMGVPHDIFKPFMPPILRSFDKAWPRINLVLHSSGTLTLHEEMEEGKLDIILTTEQEPGKDMLMADSLVWAGMRGGQACRRSPVPMALGDGRCTFRQVALEALTAKGIDWKLSCHTGTHDPILAILEADLGVAPFMSKTVPTDLEIISEASGLPSLPPFYINMYLKTGQNNPAVLELAEHVRKSFAGRLSLAA
ncbi:MAG: LysR family transcriptional regulator [Pseudomonadota bacterium]